MTARLIAGQPEDVTAQAFSGDRRNLADPFDIIRDVYGCTDELEALPRRLGHTVTWREMFGNRDVYVLRPDGRMLVFVGDLTDHAPPRSADVHASR